MTDDTNIARVLYEVGDDFDAKVAAWVRTMNRGVPPWGSLGPAARDWWRRRYVAHHPDEK